MPSDGAVVGLQICPGCGKPMLVTVMGWRCDTCGIPTDGYPDDNPKTAYGVAKPPLHAIPPIALLLLGRAMAEGKRKYGLTNWRHKPITESTFYDALLRHLLSWWDGEELDPATGIPHLALVMANAAILLDAQAVGTLNRDRPGVRGTAGAYIAEAGPPPPAAHAAAEGFSPS